MIKVSNISKSYGKIRALKKIDLNIREGEFYGLLGPNGAGKTTTINILSTILKPDSGEVIINGFNMKTAPKKCKASIGIVPQELALYEELTAYENLIFWGSLYSFSRSAVSVRAIEMLKLFGLDDRRNSLIKTYSGGMKRRINIAAAMLHQPKILLMDEPTVGVDPQSRHLIYEILEKFVEDGVTIVYTTHYMDEVEKLCNRIGIIDYGEIIAEGNLEELRNFTGISESIIVHFHDDESTKNRELINTFGEKAVFYDNKMIYSSHDTTADLSFVIEKLKLNNIPIRQIELEKASLENIFLKLTGRKLRD